MRGQSALSRRDSERSASRRPPVWQREGSLNHRGSARALPATQGWCSRSPGSLASGRSGISPPRHQDTKRAFRGGGRVSNHGFQGAAPGEHAMGGNPSRTQSPTARAARGPAFRWLGVLVSWWFKTPYLEIGWVLPSRRLTEYRQTGGTLDSGVAQRSTEFAGMRLSMPLCLCASVVIPACLLLWLFLRLLQPEVGLREEGEEGHRRLELRERDLVVDGVGVDLVRGAEADRRDAERACGGAARRGEG